MSKMGKSISIMSEPTFAKTAPEPGFLLMVKCPKKSGKNQLYGTQKRLAATTRALVGAAKNLNAVAAKLIKSDQL
jgi:dsRNA-specific ribonuclease